VRTYSPPKTSTNSGTYTPPKTYDPKKEENKQENKSREYKREVTNPNNETIKKEPKKEGEES